MARKIHQKKLPRYRIAQLLFLLLLLTAILLLPASWLQGQRVDAESVQDVDRESVLAHLYAVQSDLAVIGDLLDDPQMDFFSEASDGDDELTVEQMDAMISLSVQHRQAIEQTLQDASARKGPDLPALKQCRTAKLALLTLAAGMLAEYEQVIQYSANLMTIGADLTALSEYDDTDLARLYETYEAVLTRSASLLRDGPTPSFLQIMNDRLIDALLQMNDAVFYSLLAAELDDPVRLNSADYRLSIIVRRFESIMADVSQDVDSRQQKLMQDAAEIQRVHDGLNQWVNDNISRFGQEQER